MSKESDKQKESTIPTVSEDSNTLGNIRINHSVVASIVRLAALEVSGVAAVSGGFVDGIAERLFSKKGGESGVRVEEDEGGDYRIEIHVILRFGVELAAVAKEIQQRIADQVEKMTSTSVAHVNVFIDGVRTDDEKAEPEQWGDEPHTD
jgi:uncharacterized alkaline shock family protein YloU